MTVDLIRHFLLYCVWMNLAILVLWFVGFLVAKDWIYNIHHQWFPMSRESFDIVHYCLFGLYKLMVFLFVIIPYFAMGLIGKFG